MTRTPTPEQRSLALKRANRIRIATAELKRECARGERTVREALKDPRAANTPAFDILTAFGGIGGHKARKALVAAQWDPDGPVNVGRPCSALTERQIGVLEEFLRPRRQIRSAAPS